MSCPCSRPCQGAPDNSPLMRHGEVFRFERGDRLWTQGEVAESVVAICTGAVKTVREWSTDKGLILDLVFRGGIVGTEAALSHARRPNSCMALSSGRAVRVTIGKLRLLVAEDLEVSNALLKAAARAQLGFADRIDETQLGPVEQRLARVLLRLADEVGLRDSRGTFVPVALSRGDLADLVGCRVETTIRIMTKWQRGEVVDTQREGIILKDRDALEAAASA